MIESRAPLPLLAIASIFANELNKKIAVVVNHELGYRLSIMSGTYRSFVVSDENYDIFYSIEEALEWLTERSNKPIAGPDPNSRAVQLKRYRLKYGYEHMKKCHVHLSTISIFYIIIVSLFVSPAVAIQYSCEGALGVSISAPNDKMVDHACNAADRTIRFLGKYNLKPKRAIFIEIIEGVINQDGYKAFGTYDRQSDRIQMISLPALLQSSESPKMYNMPFDEEHYIGALGHEITHAIFHHNSSNIEEKWNNAAQEYLAHATQIAILPAQRRDEIIKSEDTGPWESGDEISVTYMGFNTTGFAVKSYLHLTQTTDPQLFIQILLNHKWLYISVP